MPDETERTEREEPEPSLVERTERPSPGEEPEDERPTDYALGRELTEMRQRQDRLDAAQADLASSLSEALSSLPQAIAEAVEAGIQALQEDSHGEAPNETPLEANPGLKWWEKGLLGRR